MKNIAFKRAKSTPGYQDVLHPDFITEYADCTSFPEGFHKSEDGYEIMPEDYFLKELAKNEQLIEEFKQIQQERRERRALENKFVDARKQQLERRRLRAEKAKNEQE